MSKKFKIYFKDSDKARLADYRVRIVKEINPREPCDHEDLVFEKANGKVPSNAIYTWYFAPMGVTFYTTTERCKQMVSEDPSYWTKEKLKEFATIEGKFYRYWWEGCVYGYIIEKWGDNRRDWIVRSSMWGCYGKKDLFDNIKDEIGDECIPICIDDEEMKYEFDNCETYVNQFVD